MSIKPFVYRIEAKGLELSKTGPDFIEFKSAGPVQPCGRPGQPDKHCQLTAMAIDGGAVLEREQAKAKALEEFNAWNLFQLKYIAGDYDSD